MSALASERANFQKRFLCLFSSAFGCGGVVVDGKETRDNGVRGGIFLFFFLWLEFLGAGIAGVGRRY